MPLQSLLETDCSGFRPNYPHALSLTLLYQGRNLESPEQGGASGGYSRQDRLVSLKTTNSHGVSSLIVILTSKVISRLKLIGSPMQIDYLTVAYPHLKAPEISTGVS